MRRVLLIAAAAFVTTARADVSVERARAALAEGRLADALTAFQAAKAQTPEYADALALTGIYEPALAVLETLHAQHPRDADVYASAGWIFFYAGDLQIARALWEVGAGNASDEQRRARAALEGMNTIGVATATLAGDGSGAWIRSVTPGPPQLLGGLRAGDVVLGVDVDKVNSPADLEKIVARARPGQHLALSVRRNGAVIPVAVEVASTRPEPVAQPAAGEPPKPSRELLDRLDWADFLLLEHHPFQAALTYARIVDRYPSWFLPYLNESMALEEIGALGPAREAMKRAVALPKPDLGSEAKAALAQRLDALEKTASQSGAAWREQQRVVGPIDAETALEPGGNYLGFGGAQLTLGGTTSFGLSGRIGHLFPGGVDASATVALTVPGALSLGAAIFQRFYAPANTRQMSFNLGASAAVDTGGTIALGPMAGLSFFIGDKRDQSFDIGVSASLLSNPAVIVATFGATQFFGR